MDNKTNLKKLHKLLQTPTSEGLKYFSHMREPTTDFLCHLVHSIKKYSPPEHMQHIKNILHSKDAKEAKRMFIKAHTESGGNFMDWVKKGASAVAQGVKSIGDKALGVTGSFFNKAVPLANKGMELAKPYIKEYLPNLVEKGANMIPVIGPAVAPIAKKGADWLLSKWV